MLCSSWTFWLMHPIALLTPVELAIIVLALHSFWHHSTIFASLHEKNWFFLDRRWGQARLQKFKSRGINGLKSSTVSWSANLHTTAMLLGFHSTVAYPDVYWYFNVKPHGWKNYENILVYIDNIFIDLHTPQEPHSRKQACYIYD